MMELPALTLLGQQVDTQPQYHPGILQPIARAPLRAQLGLGAALPFSGQDVWTGYELGWLAPSGVPQVAVLKAAFPADSPALVESKSFKLYLNSYARLQLDGASTVAAQIGADLSAAVAAPVAVQLWLPAQWPQLQPASREGVCIDQQVLELAPQGQVQPQLLRADSGRTVQQSLVSHVFRSNCPVTGQPDWASVYIDYRGPAIATAGLLAYLVSFREVREFHEHCVERIHLDLLRHCCPEWLRVEARFTRRGGLDINPCRISAASGSALPPALQSDLRDWRQ